MGTKLKPAARWNSSPGSPIPDGEQGLISTPVGLWLSSCPGVAGDMGSHLRRARQPSPLFFMWKTRLGKGCVAFGTGSIRVPDVSGRQIDGHGCMEQGFVFNDDCPCKDMAKATLIFFPFLTRRLL